MKKINVNSLRYKATKLCFEEDDMPKSECTYFWLSLGSMAWLSFIAVFAATMVSIVLWVVLYEFIGCLIGLVVMSTPYYYVGGIIVATILYCVLHIMVCERREFTQWRIDEGLEEAPVRSDFVEKLLYVKKKICREVEYVDE